MDSKAIAAVLAEEIRTNAELRRQMGMHEGSESGLINPEGTEVGITTDDGNFFIEVQEG